jgi:eukaryotic-like serine/threonine-protein kinase
VNAPEQISKYKIARLLGKGSMGVVYEGFDPDIQRRVAIKTLIPNISDQNLIAEFHSRFKIEAQASARCMHPNIVTILEYGDINGMPFMVMEFIEGRPLDDILKMNAPIRFNRALKIFSQLLKGLHFAHQSGVVHRDIKPSNVMVTDTDAVKITDFGIARLPVSSEVTQIGYTVGTPHYMAPEQEASSIVDGRADLFSATVILMELLAKVPVTSAVQHFSLSPKGIYITPRVDMNQLIPAPFLPVIQCGLAFRPDARYENAQLYAAAVKDAVDELRVLTGDTGSAPADKNRQLQSQSISSQRLQEQKQQWRDMEKMLINYIGPIGASLIELHKNQVSSIAELAQKVAVEINSPGERALFLRAWESDDEIILMPAVNTDRVQTTIKAVDANATVLQSATQAPHAQKQSPRVRLDRKELRQVEDLYSQYVGPMAEFLLQEGIDVSRDFSELVEKLTEAIPNSREKTEFKRKVRQIAG